MANHFIHKEDTVHDALMVFYVEHSEEYKEANSTIFYDGCPCLIGPALDALASQGEEYKAAIVKAALKLMGIRVEVIKNTSGFQDILDAINKQKGQDPTKN